MIKALLALLRVRFGLEETRLEGIRAQLISVENIEQLEALHIIAAQAEHLETFEQALNEMTKSSAEH